jgi:hypothetical protein
VTPQELGLLRASTDLASFELVAPVIGTSPRGIAALSRSDESGVTDGGGGSLYVLSFLFFFEGRGLFPLAAS